MRPSGATIVEAASVTETGTGNARRTVPPDGGAPVDGVPESTKTVQPAAHSSPVASDDARLGPATTRTSSAGDDGAPALELQASPPQQRTAIRASLFEPISAAAAANRRPWFAHLSWRCRCRLVRR